MSGLRIDAGANRPAGPQRPQSAAASAKPSAPASRRESVAAAAPNVNHAVLARLRDVMAQVQGPLTSDQQKAVQAELDRLQAELVQGGNDQGQVQATLAHLSVASQNMTASGSRLSDIGAARAAAQLAQEQIRSQMPTALQAQANAAAGVTHDLLGS